MTRSQESEPTREEYARLAARYDRRWRYYVDASIRETLARLSTEPRDSVLDIGCGTGSLLLGLARRSQSLKLTGVDLTDEMLRVAQRKLGGRATLQQGNAEKLPFSDEAFDAIVSTSVFHYVRSPEVALAEILRVLKPGGRVLISDWCSDYLACQICDVILRIVNRAHYHTYGREECGSILRQSGLEEVSVESYKIDWFWGMMTAFGQKPD